MSKSLTIIFILLVSAIGTHAQHCVGEIGSYSCPGTSTFSTMAISGGGTVLSGGGFNCDMTVQWTTPGTHYVIYSDIMDSSNDYTYPVTVISPSGATVNSTTPTPICPGQSATLQATYNGTIVRWERSSNNVNWQTITHTQATYTATNLQASTYFRVIVNSCGSQSPSTSRYVEVTVPQAGWIDVVAGSPLYCGDGNTNFTVGWSSDFGGIFRWFEYRQMDGGTWGSWHNVSAGPLVTTYEFSVGEPTQIRGLVNFNGCEIYTGSLETGSRPATVAGYITMASGNPLVCPGTSISLNINGNIGNVDQWFIRGPEQNWGNLSSPDNILIYGPHYFKARVQNDHCPSMETPEFFVDIIPEAGGTISPSVQEICYGGTAYFNLSNLTSSSITWQKRNEGSQTWTTVSQATAPTFISGNLTVSSSWRAFFDNGCGIVYSNVVEVDVLPDLPVPQTTNVTICSGAVAQLKVDNPQPIPWRYVWYTYNNNVYTEERVTGENEFNVSGLTSGKTYYVAFEKIGCVGPKTPITVSILNQVAVPNDPTITITHTPAYNVTLHSNNVSTSGLTYYWQNRLTGLDESSSLSNVSMPSEGLYYVRAKSSAGCWSDVSNPVKVINHTPKPGYANSQYNYIRVYNFQDRSTEVTYATNLDLETDAEKLQVQTTYFDGLGKPLQTVAKKASRIKKDLVSPIEYDVIGREERQYLPFASSKDNGEFNTNPFLEQRSFYDGTQSVSDSYFPFTYIEAEPSPLDRVEKVFGAGEDWAGFAGNPQGKSTAVHYLTNGESDAVKIWQVDGGSLPITNSVYAAGDLMLRETRDEQNNKVREFTSKEGNVILKRVQANDAATEWADTYYIYDDLNNLVFVLPPEGVKQYLLLQN